MGQLFGRADMAALVQQAMAARARPGPVLVFEGPPGSGKTSLLEALNELMSNRVPSALLDLDNVRAQPDKDEVSAIPSLVAELAFQLAGQAGSYGALSFPRLVIGLLVQKMELEQVDRGEARRQVDAALRNRRGVDRWARTLEEAATQLVPPGGLAVPSSLMRELINGLLKLANRWGPGRRVLLGPYQQWYGHQDLGLDHDPINVLIELKRWSATAARNPNNQRRVDDLLLRAFLADLRDEYRRAERAGGWSYNSVVLLDNVDGELGQAFLAQLAQVRRNATAVGTAGQDPLTVVVTSRGALLSNVDDSGPAEQRWWQRVPMPSLTLDEISAMMAPLALLEGDNQHLATLVHELTRGQAAATESLLDALGEKERADVELAALLRTEYAEGSLEDRLLDRLLSGVEVGSSPDLEVCAAARSPEPIKRLARDMDLERKAGDLAVAPLWGPDDDEVTLVRRLLLRRLAATDRWTKAFEALRVDAVEQLQDADLGLYYAAGLGQWGPIATELTGRLGPGAMPEWLDALHRIAGAPTRPLPDIAPEGPPPAPPHELAENLAQPWIAAGPKRFVTVLNLLTALSVSHDPLCGIDRGSLYRRIGDFYRDLSEYPNLSCHELDVLERRYRRLSRDWHRPARTAG